MPLISHSDYKPPTLLFNAHLQTIYPALFRKVKVLPSKRIRITTPDHDFLDLDHYEHQRDKIVILSHGLEGDSKRPYIFGMIRSMVNNGWDCVAWNFRGCSGEVNLQARFYHSGATEDLQEVIDYVRSLKKYKTIVLIGFSLGGNLTLKYLGEQGDQLPGEIKRAVTFSVPLDLHSSCLKISQPSQFIYSERFLRNLKAKVKAKSERFPDKLEMLQFDAIKTIMEFDDYYTAPLHGFRDAIHYYSECSSINFIQKIKIPTLIVNAQNDPFLSEECYPFDSIESHPTVYFESPKEGGHCGFALFNNDNYYWSELRTLQFAAGSS